MTVLTLRDVAVWLDAQLFAARHPRPYIVLGRIDPDVTSKSRRPDDQCLPLLAAAIDLVGNVGEWSGTVENSGWTIRLAFARGDDAARLCAFLKATPVPNGIDSDFMASFRLDRRLYDDLLEVRDVREQGRQAA
ncbi:MAG: hypothetical protein Q8L22_00965 [Reyranella sp.]|nr:hypothetical protein [Reyranella sp.]